MSIGRRCASALLFVLGLALAWQAHAREWRFDREASRLVFEARQGQQRFEAAFERFDAEIRFDPQDLDDSRVRVTVDVASLATPDASRTEQALSAMWLGAAEHPTARYETLAFRRKEGDLYEVDARLTIKGITREVTHEARISIDGPTARATGGIPLARKDFDVGSRVGPETIGLEVVVRFEVVAHAA